MEINQDIYYLLGQYYASMEKGLKFLNLTAKSDIPIIPSSMRLLLPDYKKLIEMDNSKQGIELQEQFKIISSLILYLPEQFTKDQEELWLKGYYDAQLDVDVYRELN